MDSLNDEIAPTVDWVVKELYRAPCTATFQSLVQKIIFGYEDKHPWVRRTRTAIRADLDALLRAPTANDHRAKYRTDVYSNVRRYFADEYGLRLDASQSSLAKIQNTNNHKQFLALMARDITTKARRKATRQRAVLERGLENRVATAKIARAAFRAVANDYWCAGDSYYRLRSKQGTAEAVLTLHRRDLRNSKRLLKLSDAFFEKLVARKAADTAQKYLTEHATALTTQKVIEKMRSALSKWIRIGEDGRITYCLSPTAYFAPQIASVGFSKFPDARYLFGEPTEGEQGTRIDPQRFRKEPLEMLFKRYYEMPRNEKATRRLELLADAAGKESFPVPENLWGVFTAKTRDALKANDGLLTWKRQLYELQAFMQNRTEDAMVARLLRILNKYAIDGCETMLRNVRGRLRIEDAKTPEVLKDSAMATEMSCIRHSSTMEYRGMVADPGSCFLVGYRDDVLQGYARLFLIEAGTPVLGVDTIEPPHKDFDTHKDLVNAFGLAAIDIGLRMGAQMIVGSDARIKFGLRQLYGNTARRLRTPHKLGFPEPMTRYTMFDNEFLDVHVLMENWRPSADA